LITLSAGNKKRKRFNTISAKFRLFLTIPYQKDFSLTTITSFKSFYYRLNLRYHNSRLINIAKAFALEQAELVGIPIIGTESNELNKLAAVLYRKSSSKFHKLPEDRFSLERENQIVGIQVLPFNIFPCIHILHH